MALGILGEQFAGGIEMRVFANAGENIQYLATVRLRVLRSVCGQERQSKCECKIDQFAIGAFFTANEMPLKLNKNISAAEGVDRWIVEYAELSDRLARSWRFPMLTLPSRPESYEARTEALISWAMETE